MKRMMQIGWGIFSGTLLAGSIHAATVYVDVNSPGPVAPYNSWSTAATCIQDAVDAAAQGDLILVTNGVYQTGGHPRPRYLLTNRVSITNWTTVQSVNGPAVTSIVGNPAPGTNAVRGVFLGIGASLIGFTVTQGATYTNGTWEDMVGGGIWCQDTRYGYVSNCIVAGNKAATDAGGIIGGTVWNSQILGNSGVGATQNFLYDCVIVSNTGGATSSTLDNCTVTGNAIPSMAANTPGGLNGCGAYNSIVVSNTTGGFTSNYYEGAIYNCCTAPVPASYNGLLDIAVDPLFVDPLNGNFRLQSNSPCINAGNNYSAVPALIDLDGNPRISGGTVDMGAYEFQNPASMISYAWLEHYGLPTDGSADFADTDHNGMMNWQKWKAGLDPTDPSSILQAFASTNSGSGLAVTWRSVTNINYYIQRAPNLAAASFQTIATNLPGQSGTTSFVDTNAPPPGPWFYRVGVQ